MTLNRDLYAEKNQEKIAKEGAVPILIHLLQGRDDPNLKLSCAATLWNLSVNGKKRIRHVYLLLQLINLLYGDNIYAISRLLNSFRTDRNKKRIVDEGGVGTLVRILKSGDIKLQNEAVGALRNLSFLGAYKPKLFVLQFPFLIAAINFKIIEENKKIIGREGAIPYLVNFLRSNVEKLQRNSALTLRNLSANNGESNAPRYARQIYIRLNALI